MRTTDAAPGRPAARGGNQAEIGVCAFGLACILRSGVPPHSSACGRLVAGGRICGVLGLAHFPSGMGFGLREGGGLGGGGRGESGQKG